MGEDPVTNSVPIFCMAGITVWAFWPDVYGNILSGTICLLKPGAEQVTRLYLYHSFPRPCVGLNMCVLKVISV